MNQAFFFSSDKPIEKPNEDFLGYSQFAESLSKSIRTTSAKDGFVIGIFGSWGSGKTSLLKLTQYYLSQSDLNNKPIIMDFNPWWFSENEDLTKSFLAQLKANLKNSKIAHIDKLLKNIGDFADLVSDLPIPIPGFNFGAQMISKFGKLSDKPVPSIKEQISKDLRKLDHQIVVFIDDIDRLNPQEIIQVFKVIKIVADFPNIVYVVSLDKVVVQRALKEVYGDFSNDYLEKIIQAPLELPMPSKEDIWDMFFKKLNLIISDTPPDLFNQRYWANIFYAGINELLEIPRDVIRLTNILSLTYPLVKGEVNPVDFITMEAIRLFLPSIHETIKTNQSLFTSDGSLLRGTQGTTTNEFYDSAVNSLNNPKHKKIAMNLIAALFPRLRGIWRGTSFNSEWENNWRKQLRICSDEVFPIYFKLSVPSNYFSTLEILNTLELLKNEDGSFSEKLETYSKTVRSNGTSKIRAFLMRVEDYVSDSNYKDYVAKFIQTLFDLGDSFISKEGDDVGMFDIPNHIRIVRVTRQLLRQLDPNIRHEVVIKCIEAGYSITTMVNTVMSIAGEHGKFGHEPNDHLNEKLIPSLDNIEIIIIKCLEKIREQASKGTLIDHPQSIWILSFWSQVVGTDEPTEWVSNIVQDPVLLVKLLKGFVNTTKSSASGDIFTNTRYSINPKVLQYYIDVDKLSTIVDSINLEDISDEDKRIIYYFQKGLELFKQGKDPDNPLSYLNV